MPPRILKAPIGLWFSCLTHTSAPIRRDSSGQRYCGVGGTIVRTRAAERRRRRRAYDELTALDDRSLADIGIHRSQIPAMVDAMYQSAHADPVKAPALGARAPRLVSGHR